MSDQKPEQSVVTPDRLKGLSQKDLDTVKKYEGLLKDLENRELTEEELKDTEERIKESGTTDEELREMIALANKSDEQLYMYEGKHVPLDLEMQVRYYATRIKKYARKKNLNSEEEE